MDYDYNDYLTMFDFHQKQTHLASYDNYRLMNVYPSY